MVSKRDRLYNRAIAILSDPEHVKKNPTPMFGYRPEYHSQAEADYARLTQIAQHFSLSDAPRQAMDAYEQANPYPKTAADYSRALTGWMDYAPTSSPGVITAFAQAAIPQGTPGTDEALAVDAQLQALQDANSQNVGGSAGQENATASWLEDHTAWLRGVTRTGIDFLTAPLQAVQGSLSGAAGSLGILGADLNGQEADWGQAAWQLAGLFPGFAAIGEAMGQYKAPNPWEQTVAGQTLLDFMGMPSGTTTGTEVTPGFGTVNTGDGWLGANPDEGVGLAQRQATYQSARNKYNQSWTLGRGLASMVTDSPDSTLYKVGSGVVDAVVSVFLDPTIVGGKFALVGKGAREAKALAAAAEEANTLKALRAEATALDDATRAANEARIAELEAQAAESQKFLDSLTPEQRAEVDSLLGDEQWLKEQRPLDQAERDAWVAAQREQALIPEDPRHYQLTGQRDELLDQIAAETAREQRLKTRAAGYRGRAIDEPDDTLIDSLNARYGPDGLENEYSALSSDVGMLAEQYPGGVFTSSPLTPVKRGQEYGGTFTTESGATYTRNETGQYVFPDAQPFEKTLFAKPQDAEAIRAAQTRGSVLDETGQIVGVRYDRIKDPQAYDEAIANGADEYSAMVAAGSAIDYVPELSEVPRKGLVPIEFNPSDGSAFVGEKIAAVTRNTEALGDTPKWFPSYSQGGETVAAWTGRSAPKIVDASAPIDVEGVFAALKHVLIETRRGGLKGASATRRDTLAGYESLLTDPALGATYGHLFSYAAETGTTKALAEALARAGVDGIENVRPILGTGDVGGVWWANAGDLQVRALPVTVGQVVAHQALPELRSNLSALKGQVSSIEAEMAKIAADRKDAVTAAYHQYDQYQRVVAAQRLNEANDLLPVLREQLMTQAGIRNTPDLKQFVDQGKMYDFLFKGRAGRRAFDLLADIESPSEVMRITKWDAATAERVAAAKTREEILAALAPEFGLSVDHSLGRLATGLRYKRGAAMERSKFYNAVERATGTFVPIGQRVDYSDKDSMVRTLRNYMDYFGMPKDVTREYLDRIIREPEEFNQRNHVTDLFDRLQEHLIDRMANQRGISGQRLDDLKRVINDGTRVYRDVEKLGHEYWQERIARDAWPGYLMSDGTPVRLPNAHIDSEFASGGTMLPDPREMMETMGRITGLVARSDSGRSAYEWASKVSTDWWRTAMLVRGAYIVRNIAEEQIRMFLSNSGNVFANPVRMAAMTMSMSTKEGVGARLASKFATYDRGIDGTRFAVPKGDEQDLLDVHSDFLGFMADHSTSMLDNRVSNLAVVRGIQMVKPGDTGFSQGWAHQLLALRSSQVTRLVVGDYPKALDAALVAARKRGPVDEKAFVMDWLFTSPEGAKIRDYMGKSSEQMSRLMDDPVGLRNYLFDDPVGSVQARVTEMTAKDPEVLDFLRTGVLKRDGQTVWETKGRALGPLRYSDNQDYDALSYVLGKQYQDRIPTDHAITVPFQMGRDLFPKTDTIIDKFFDLSAKMERSAALGPEWKHAYWEEVAKRAHLLDAETREMALKWAKEVTPRDTWTAPNGIIRRLEDAKGKGTIGKDAIDLIASKRASEHVKGLFYDARERNAAWHATRLVFPFGQAWGNTMRQWSTLMAKNPMQVYKAGKALTALQERGSQAIYDAYNAADPFGDIHYDEDQGFFYRDPNRQDQLTFRYPMAATPLAGLLMSTQDSSLSMASPVSSLNLAFSGDNPLPGLGPIAVTGIGMSGLTDKPGPIAEVIRSMAYPFGEPDPETGIVESATPAWIKYAVFGTGVYQGGGEQFRRAQQKGALIAAASRNDYGDLTDPLNQKQWFADADGIARMASLIRGLGSFLLPTSPVLVWETKDREGNWLPIASVASQYRQQQEEYGNDRAIVNLVDQYGEKGLAAIISSTGGEKPLSDDAYKFTLANPDTATIVGPDAMAVLFPGDPSPITLAWQKANGMRRDLSWNEKQDAALGLLYRYQMAEVQRAAAAGNWSADDLQMAKDSVLERFGGKVPPRSFDPNYYDNLLAGLRQAVVQESMQGLPSIEPARQALALYDTTLASYRQHARDPRATLTGKEAAMWRDELHSQLAVILQQNPQAAGVVDVLMSMTEER